MGKANNEVLIKNENLFRALFSGLVAILFSILAVSYLGSSGLLLFKVLFVLAALYFSLSTLAYAAYYTNDLQEE